MPILTIIAIIQAAAALLPELAAAVPIVSKALEGQTITPAELASLDAVAQSLGAQAAAGAA